MKNPGISLSAGRRGMACISPKMRAPELPIWTRFAPAATVRCDGAPAVIALDESGAITREMDDYLGRYKPQALYCLGPLPREAASTQRPWHALDADSADAAAAEGDSPALGSPA